MTEYSDPGRGGGIQQRVSDAAQQATDRLSEAGTTVRGQVGRQVGERSTDAGEQVGAAGDAMRQAGEQLRAQGNDLPAQLAEQVAAQADRLGRYLRESDGETILRDAEDFARRQPWVVAGAGLVAGLGVARLLKASSRRAHGGGGYDSASAGPSPTTVPSSGPEPVGSEPPLPYGSPEPAPPVPAPVPPSAPAPSSFARPAPPPGGEDEEARPPAEGWR